MPGRGRISSSPNAIAQLYSKALAASAGGHESEERAEHDARDQARARSRAWLSHGAHPDRTATSSLQLCPRLISRGQGLSRRGGCEMSLGLRLAPGDDGQPDLTRPGSQVRGRGRSRTPPPLRVDWSCHVELVRLLGGSICGVVDWCPC